jgi:hypothetical protein
VLARFTGFGPVALSIFPNPVTGQYKDGWKDLGEELEWLLQPDEYDSAKRTTFNAFYTSPTVIASIHEAISRLGVPKGATILEPGCGTGNFMNQGSQGQRFIGVEMDSISGRIAKALHPDQDIRIENFRDTKLPEGRALTRWSATCRLPTSSSNSTVRSYRCTISSSPRASMPSNPAASWPL